MSLRDRKKQQTKDRILAAAEDLFTRSGFDPVAMEEIAAAADVSLATLYNYFPNKADLAFKAVIATAAAYVVEQEAALHAGAGDAEAAVALVVDAFMALIGRFDQSLLRRVVMLTNETNAEYGRVYSDLNRAFAEQLGRVLAACQADGRLDPSLEHPVLQRLIFNIVEAEFLAYVQTDGLPLKELRATIDRQLELMFRLARRVERCQLLKR